MSSWVYTWRCNLQKISGILPSSARVTSVDLRESGAARPGAPNFGRPIGESNLMNNSITRSAHRALQQHNELSSKRTKEQQQAQEIQKMADEFFKTKTQINKENDLAKDLILDQETSLAPTIDIPTLDSQELESLGIRDTHQAQNKSMSALDLDDEEMNLPEVGRYIDVMA